MVAGSKRTDVIAAARAHAHTAVTATDVAIERAEPAVGDSGARLELVGTRTQLVGHAGTADGAGEVAAPYEL